MYLIYTSYLYPQEYKTETAGFLKALIDYKTLLNLLIILVLVSNKINKKLFDQPQK